MAYPHARPNGRLNAVLVERHDECRGQLVGLMILDPDRRVDASENMRLDGLGPELLLHLREKHYTGFILIAVLSRKNLLDFVVQIIAAADFLHALDYLVVVDAFKRCSIDIVLLIGATKGVEVHLFDGVGLEIELLPSSLNC